MSNFGRCFLFTVGAEGGHVDDPLDPGGETKYGISARAYPELDIRSLTLADAQQIYEEDYWTPIHGDELPGPLALYTFDTAVNSGIERAVKILQAAISATPVDGIIGPRTLEQAGRYMITPGLHRFHDEREKFYKSLPSFPRFGRGWLSRNDQCLDAALQWAREGEKT